MMHPLTYSALRTATTEQQGLQIIVEAAMWWALALATSLPEAQLHEFRVIVQDSEGEELSEEAHDRLRWLTFNHHDAIAHLMPSTSAPCDSNVFRRELVKSLRWYLMAQRIPCRMGVWDQ
jgi:hypothetical protein